MRRLGATRGRRQVRLLQARYFQLLHLFQEHGAWPCKASPPAPNPITAAPTKSSAKSSATASWIRKPPPEVIAQKLRQTQHAHQHSQRRTGHRRLRPAKKNSTPLTPKPRPRPSSPNAPAKRQRLNRPTRRAWSGRSASCWPTRSPATRSASGCWCPNTCAWAPGTCSAAGPAPRPEPSSRAWPANDPRGGLVHLQSAPGPHPQPERLRSGQRPALRRQRSGRFTNCSTPTPCAEAQGLQIALGKLRRASGHFERPTAGHRSPPPPELHQTPDAPPSARTAHAKPHQNGSRPSSAWTPTPSSRCAFTCPARRAPCAQATPRTAGSWPTDPRPQPGPAASPGAGRRGALRPPRSSITRGSDALRPAGADDRQPAIKPARWRALPEEPSPGIGRATPRPSNLTTSAPSKRPGFELVQRSGEQPGDYQFKGFFCTARPPRTGRPSARTIPNAGTSRSSSSSTKPWAGSAPAPSTSTSATAR